MSRTPTPRPSPPEDEGGRPLTVLLEAFFDGGAAANRPIGSASHHDITHDSEDDSDGDPLGPGPPSDVLDPGPSLR